MSCFDSSALLVLLALILIFILNVKAFMAKASKLQPPGPKPWPIIGNLHILNLKRPYQTMLEVRQKAIQTYMIILLGRGCVCVLLRHSGPEMLNLHVLTTVHICVLGSSDFKIDRAA